MVPEYAADGEENWHFPISRTTIKARQRQGLQRAYSKLGIKAKPDKVRERKD